MSDLKSKMPDLKELASMTGKLYKDIKTSVGEIIKDYKEARIKPTENVKNPEPTEATAPKTKAASKTTETKKD